MKSTGMIRKIDELGRIVLPIEIRKNMDIKEKDEIEIFIENDRIILQKHDPACVFCNSAEELFIYMDKPICKACLDKLGTKR
ncbi:MAG: AbrB/MazE/SpoVT family DNA-binding domain-containing protein [Clostridia bacterium]|nr:AbrB/MazE/SpoVT family DNA-binding domain-containing protein [Clostridia bacterium]